MKKLCSLLLALALVMTSACAALADTTLDGTDKRKIKLANVGLNTVEDGISPTTGLALADYDQPDGFAGLAITGRYMPMLVQIDNSDGGVGERAPWGATYADIIYESPLHRSGFTRLSFLFSDVIPDSVGPVRSARVGHVWLREEWDAGFLYYGGQERNGSNINEEFKKYGATKKGVLFSGLVSTSKPWKEFYNRRSGIASPHNVDANVAAMCELIDADFTPPNHAFLFTDDMPKSDVYADEISIDWTDKRYNSTFTYDADSNLYYRYMNNGSELIPYEDLDSGEQLGFSNLIIQRTKVTYNNSSDAPVTEHVGEGNAEIFMGGVYIAGYWKRADMASRTVFYDADGNEIALQRGKTWISIIPTENTVTFR